MTPTNSIIIIAFIAVSVTLWCLKIISFNKHKFEEINEKFSLHNNIFSSIFKYKQYNNQQGCCKTGTKRHAHNGELSTLPNRDGSRKSSNGIPTVDARNRIPDFELSQATQEPVWYEETWHVDDESQQGHS